MTRILVITNDDRLQMGIKRLVDKPECVVVLRKFSNDEKEIVGHIQQTVPDAVIIDTTLVTSGSLQVAGLLQSVKKLRVLLMSPYSNEIQVYDKREERLEQSADLINMI